MRVAWIGTGVMGRSMAMHLLKAGDDLRITTRTPARAEELLAAGATRCAPP
ncbi:MAG: NAD(P)-binding domain-containing protein, partial [Phycisphaerales bacterium]